MSRHVGHFDSATTFKLRHVNDWCGAFDGIQLVVLGWLFDLITFMSDVSAEFQRINQRELGAELMDSSSPPAAMILPPKPLTATSRIDNFRYSPDILVLKKTPSSPSRRAFIDELFGKPVRSTEQINHSVRW
jgi:hypothetical protein